jgi:hypothetical protein
VSEDKISESYQRIQSDPLALLSQVLPGRGRHRDLLRRQCFRIRGVTWFNERLGQGRLVVTRCDDFIKDMRAILKTRHVWKKKGFNLEQTEFSLRQLVNAVSDKRIPLSLQKAVMCMVLCEAILTALQAEDPSQPPGQAVYAHMYIEPAIHYITGLTTQRAEELLKKKGFFGRFRAHTGQSNRKLLGDIAAGLTVTEGLAWRAYDVLKEFDDEAGVINPPESQYDADRKYKASEHEDVTEDERELPPRPTPPK